jgi:cobalamin biosynthesis protein CbiG
VIVAGVGCSLGCAADEVLALVDGCLGEAGVPRDAVRVLATVDRRGREPGIVAAARRRGWSLRTFAAADLAEVAVPTPSQAVAAHVGTPSVAEAAALLAAPGGTLVLAKRRSPHATCALARTVAEEPPWPA